MLARTGDLTNRLPTQMSGRTGGHNGNTFKKPNYRNDISGTNWPLDLED